MEEQNVANPFGEVGAQENPTNVNEQLQQIAESAEEVPQQEPVAEAVPVRYAGFWIRVIASLIDGLIMGAAMGASQAILGKIVGSGVGYILVFGYLFYMLNTYQATLGKMAVGIKVTASNGEKLSLGKIALREIVGKFVDSLTLCIGYLMVAFTQKKQGLHDIIADSVVVYKK